MTYNKSEIMKRAWDLYRIWEFCDRAFAVSLKEAWEEAKSKAQKEENAKAKAEMLVPSDTFENLESALFILNMKDYHNHEDRQEVSRLEVAIKRTKLAA